MSETLTANEEQLFTSFERVCLFSAAHALIVQQTVLFLALPLIVCCWICFDKLHQALDDSDRIVLDSTFGSISGVAAKYGLGGNLPPFEQRSAKELSASIIHEICELEEEAQGLALQRNREAREVRRYRDVLLLAHFLHIC